MLHKLVGDIAAAREEAAAAEQQAREATDPQLRSVYERMALGWRTLAQSFQRVQNLEQFLIGSQKNRPLPPSPPSKNWRAESGTPPFMFLCPVTGSQVQGFLIEETPGDDPDSFEPVSCIACGQIHLVNFKTRKIVGEYRAD